MKANIGVPEEIIVDLGEAKRWIADLQAENAELRRRLEQDRSAVIMSQPANKISQPWLERLHSVFQHANAALIVTDLGGNVTHWNLGAERLFGYQENEASGFPIEFLCYDENSRHSMSDILGRPIVEELNRESPREVEVRTRKKSGDDCCVRLSMSVLRDENAHASGFLWIAMDVTAHLLAERALRDSEERFRLAFKAINGIVYDWNPQTGTVCRSGRLEKILGVATHDATEDESWWQARIHPEDRGKSSKSVLARLAPHEDGYETEFRMMHVDGHWINVSDRGYVVRDAQGLPVRVVGSSHDITSEKSLELELRESNKQLKFQADILSATNDAVIALDSDLCIRYCNAAAERIYKTRLADVVGKPMIAMHGYGWLNKEDEQKCLEDLRRGSWKGEYIHILNDGTEIVVQSTVNVLPEESGGGMVAIIRDITGRKKEDMRIQQQAKLLARANDDLLHFAYAVSHDLHAPLRTITSFSQLLALKFGQGLGKDGGEFVRWIVDAGKRMDTMLNDLLRFATVAGGDTNYSDSVSLEQTVNTVLGSLRSAVEETGAVITHDALPTVTGDAGQIVQLFQNLIGNSLKYHRIGTAPKIHIAAERSGDEWIVSVSDNGLGFEAKYADQIFGVFKRLHDKEFAGTGIGLTISKRIVERRGGRIWAEGRPGEGAIFSFSIPDLNNPLHQDKPMEWGNVRSALRDSPEVEQHARRSDHFDELFQLLDLAQAIVRNMDGSIVIWTKGAERLFGWTETEAVGRQLHELLRTESPTPLIEIDNSLLRRGEWDGELKVHRRNGDVIWVASHKTLYRDGSGRPQSVIEVHNNITLLKAAQSALAHSSQQRDMALEAGQMGVWKMYSRTGRVEWSPTLEAMLGMPVGSFEGTLEAARERTHPEHRDAVDEKVAQALRTGSNYWTETRLRRDDGSYCWVRAQGRVFFDDTTVERTSEPSGLIGVVWDISDRMQRDDDRQFMLELSSKISRLSEVSDMADLAVAEVVRYLKVMRCTFNEVDSSGTRLKCVAEHHIGTKAPVESLPLSDYPHIVCELAKNHVVAINDVARDPRTSDRHQDRFLARGVASFVLVPLHRAGIWLSNIGVSTSSSRSWQEREINLLHAVAQRLEAALDISRLNKGLGEKRTHSKSHASTKP